MVSNLLSHNWRDYASGKQRSRGKGVVRAGKVNLRCYGNVPKTSVHQYVPLVLTSHQVQWVVPVSRWDFVISLGRTYYTCQCLVIAMQLLTINSSTQMDILGAKV